MKIPLVFLSVACLACLVDLQVHASGLFYKGLGLSGGRFVAVKELETRKIHGARIITQPIIKTYVPQRTIVLRPPEVSTILERVLSVVKTVHTVKTVVEPTVVHREETVVLPSYYYKEPETIVSPVIGEEHLEVDCDPEPEIVERPLIKEHTVVVPSVHHEQKVVVAPALVTPTSPSVAIIGPTMNVYQHPLNNAYNK